jgi:hypothetical protein
MRYPRGKGARNIGADVREWSAEGRRSWAQGFEVLFLIVRAVAPGNDGSFMEGARFCLRNALEPRRGGGR